MDFHERRPKLLEIYSVMDAGVGNIKNKFLINFKILKTTKNHKNSLNESIFFNSERSELNKDRFFQFYLLYLKHYLRLCKIK